MNKILRTAGWLSEAAARTIGMTGMTACTQGDLIHDETQQPTDGSTIDVAQQPMGGKYIMTVKATKGGDAMTRPMIAF